MPENCCSQVFIKNKVLQLNRYYKCCFIKSFSEDLNIHILKPSENNPLIPHERFHLFCLFFYFLNICLAYYLNTSLSSLRFICVLGRIMTLITFAPQCHSFEYVTLPGKRDFVDVVKFTNESTSKQGDYPDRSNVFMELLEAKLSLRREDVKEIWKSRSQRDLVCPCKFGRCKGPQVKGCGRS